MAASEDAGALRESEVGRTRRRGEVEIWEMREAVTAVSG